jgi:proline dehydrogenase
MNLLNTVIARTLPLVPKPIVGRFSRRYIAGESLDDAVSAVHALNATGCMATLDVLGEFISTVGEADQTTQTYLDVLERIDREKIDANISIKPTGLGLLIDPERCHQNVRRLVERAAELGNFVRIDMEDSSCTQATLDLFTRLRSDFENIGVAIQSYLRRTLDDVGRLAELTANVRICKGIYVEPRKIAFKDKEIVRRNFIEACRILLSRGAYVGIATHDEILVWEAEQVVRDLGLPHDAYEFQMLLGVDEQLRSLILKAGHRTRVYVPYGPHWYAYSIRRLKENPSIAGHVMKAILGFGPERNGSGP